MRFQATIKITILFELSKIEKAQKFCVHITLSGHSTINCLCLVGARQLNLKTFEMETKPSQHNGIYRGQTTGLFMCAVDLFAVPLNFAL